MRTICKYFAKAGRILFVMYLVIAATLLTNCSNSNKEGSGEVVVVNTAEWKISSTVRPTSTASTIILSGKEGTSWYATIVEGDSWCSFKYKDFSGNYTSTEGVLQDELNTLHIYYKPNDSSAQRVALLKFNFEGEEEQIFTLTQYGADQTNLPEFGYWAELPAMKTNDAYVYATHSAMINNKPYRNYSLCFDKKNKAALWVAYPLHAVYLGGTGRTNAWAFDPSPDIPDAVQPDCVGRSYAGDYDRGHQLPSADRLASSELNAQTFYMTNMTPQLNRLNQDMWGKLEGKVRANRCADTLYVVTGAWFGSNPSTTTDGAGNTVSVPKNYFKVLLRTRNGNTGKAVTELSADELMAIGFWVEHKSYGNIEVPTSICTTVADIESKTGFKFFSTLSNEVATAVKQQNNPMLWGIK